MRLSLFLLVFMSVLSHTRAQTTAEQTTFPFITTSASPITSATTTPTATPETTTSSPTTSVTTTTTTSPSPITSATTTSVTSTLSGITTTARTTTATTTAKPVIDLPFDPCYAYTVLDDPWRSTDNRNAPTLMCDHLKTWVGWYRLFIQGRSVQMRDACIDRLSCGTNIALWLSGGHPTVKDGVVTRSICGSLFSTCCHFQTPSIKVKACPGGYYVYEFVNPSLSCSAYCAEATATPVINVPGIFYSLNSMADDKINIPSDDGNSSVIPLLSPFLFFGRKYQQIYVNNNGHLTFNQPSSQFIPNSFPAYGSQDIIAGLWTDLDNRKKGVVSYKQYTSGSVLTRATQDINNYFPNVTFSASWVFVATWNKVAYYNLTNTETSFQVVLISGSNLSFILMNYGDIAVTEHQVEAGYDTVYSTDYFVIPGSVNGSSISNLRNSSNVNVPGRWAFRVDGGVSKSNKVNTIGLQVELSSYLDLTDSTNTEIVLQQMKQELVKYGMPNNIELKIRKMIKIKP